MGRIVASAMASAAGGRLNGLYTGFVHESSLNVMRLDVNENRIKANKSDPRERPKVKKRRRVMRDTGSEESRLRHRDLRPLSV
jgi:hypothetical protein